MAEAAFLWELTQQVMDHYDRERTITHGPWRAADCQQVLARFTHINAGRRIAAAEVLSILAWSKGTLLASHVGFDGRRLDRAVRDLGIPLREDHRDEVIDDWLNGLGWHVEVQPCDQPVVQVA